MRAVPRREPLQGPVCAEMDPTAIVLRTITQRAAKIIGRVKLHGGVEAAGEDVPQGRGIGRLLAIMPAPRYQLTIVEDHGENLCLGIQLGGICIPN